MMHIAIIEKESIAKELVFHMGKVLHEYAWNFQHFISLVDFVKQDQTTPFDLVILSDKFHTNRIYNSVIKNKIYSTIFIMHDSTNEYFEDVNYLNMQNLDYLHQNLKEILLPIVKKQEAICFSYHDTSIFMKIKDIQYIEKQDKYLVYHTKLGEFRQRGNMMDKVAYFAPYGFLQIHVSYLVNEDFIIGLGKDVIILKNQIKLPISRSKHMDVKQFFDKRKI